MSSRLRKLATSALTLLALTGMGAIGHAQQGGGSSPPGAVFAMSNVSHDNRVVSFRRAANGTLTRVDSISTRGNGIGTDLDTTGGLRLSADHRFLYAVNAGSDEITVFTVNGTHLTFLQKVKAGDEPNSLTIHGNLLYVLNGSVAGNGIRGFRIGSGGRLTPLANSFRFLSSPIAVPGQVQFSPDGGVLLITHKVSDIMVPPRNAIDAFRIGSNGLPSAEPLRNESVGLRPFSLAFRSDGKLVVVESFNAAAGETKASSYRVSSNGAISPISRSVPSGQQDVCWVVITGDGRFVYTANFGTGTISAYSLSAGGDLNLLDGKAAFTGKLSQPVDLALSADSRFLYLLMRGPGRVAAFRIQDDGGLKPLGTAGGGGLPVNDGASGLAAY